MQDVLCIDDVSGRDTRACERDDLYRYRPETIVTFINQSSGEYLVYVAVLRDCWYVQRGRENVHYLTKSRDEAEVLLDSPTNRARVLGPPCMKLILTWELPILVKSRDDHIVLQPLYSNGPNNQRK